MPTRRPLRPSRSRPDQKSSKRKTSKYTTKDIASMAVAVHQLRSEAETRRKLEDVLKKIDEFQRHPQDVTRWATRRRRRSWIQIMALTGFGVSLLLASLGYSFGAIVDVVKELLKWLNKAPVDKTEAVTPPSPTIVCCCDPSSPSSPPNNTPVAHAVKTTTSMAAKTASAFASAFAQYRMVDIPRIAKTVVAQGMAAAATLAHPSVQTFATRMLTSSLHSVDDVLQAMQESGIPLREPRYVDVVGNAPKIAGVNIRNVKKVGEVLSNLKFTRDLSAFANDKRLAQRLIDELLAVLKSQFSRGCS